MSMNNSSLSDITLNENMLPPAQVILFYFGGVLLSILTIFGNFIVILVYCLNSHLQTTTHLFIFSLAISDVLIGLFSINFYVVYAVSGEWPFGYELCQVWLCMDYVVCQASIIHLIVICLDRFLSIKFPIVYRSRRTRRRGYIALVMVWVIAIVQWLPIIISYRYIVHENTVPDGQCYVQFLTDSIVATLITACLAYFIPVFILATLYFRVFIIIKHRNRNVQIFQTEPDSGINFELKCKGSNEVNDTSEKSDTGRINKRKNGIQHQFLPQELARLRYLNGQKKAAKMMTIVFMNFAISWMPYHILVILLPICGECIPKLAWDLSYIFCYFNSTINPLCYALGHGGFRRAILKALGKLKFRKLVKKLKGRINSKVYNVHPA